MTAGRESIISANPMQTHLLCVDSKCRIVNIDPTVDLNSLNFKGQVVSSLTMLY